MAEEKKTADWELIEKHYRAGIMSLREVATAGGVTEGAIRKRAKRDMWSRDLKAKIKQRAEELVRKEVVRKPSTQLTPVTEKQVIEDNAEVQYRVRMGHRTDIGRSRKMFSSLMSELESMTDDKVLFDSLGKLMAKQAANDINPVEAMALKGLYQKVMSLPNRAATAKQIVEILEKTVKMEREAFGIDDNQVADNPVDTLLRKIYKERIGG